MWLFRHFIYAVEFITRKYWKSARRLYVKIVVARIEKSVKEVRK